MRLHLALSDAHTFKLQQLQAKNLALPLLVTGIAANHTNDSMPFDDFAMATHFLN